MAVTDLDFLLPTLQQHNYDPASSIMDKQSFDLNKHAFDLNEVPLNELGLDSQEASCSHEFGSALHPRRGGWLELFHNMFGHDKVMLDSFPFATCTTMLNSSCINHMSQADRTQQNSDPRLLSSQILQLGHKIQSGNGDAAKHSVSGSNNLNFMPHQPDSHRKICKLSASNEFNHTSIITSGPLFDHAGMGGSHVGKPLFNVSGQPGCATGILHSPFSSSEGLKFKAGSGPWGCNAKGPQHVGVLYSSPEETSVGSSISQGLDHYKSSVPLWDLNSQPFPQWTADFQPLRLSKPSCITSSSNFSHKQEDGLPESNKNCKVLTACLQKEKGCASPSWKGKSSSDRGKALELINAENSPSLSEDKGKGPDLRIRIIASPDWLPAGWITEVKTRMAGSTAGTTDKYYRDPVTGRRFRSKNEVLNFLQTGRLCRNKPQLRSFEGIAAVATMPLLLPRQDQSVGPLDNAQAVSARTMYLTSAKDFSSQTSMCQNLHPPNAILERIKTKQEQMDMTQERFIGGSSDVCRVSVVTARVEESGSYTVQERIGLEANELGKPYMSVWPGISNAYMYNEPVYKHKRKGAENSVSLLSPKRFHSAVKELQGKDKWIFCMNQISREAETQEISTGAELETKIAHTSYPGLLCRQDPNGAQDKAVTDYLTARYKANAKALGLYDTLVSRSASEVNLGCTKELHPKTVSMIKAGEKKSTKVILKQERDLLVTLGRKLCEEFLASAKKSSLQ